MKLIIYFSVNLTKKHCFICISFVDFQNPLVKQDGSGQAIVAIFYLTALEKIDRR